MGCTVTKSFDPAALTEALSEPIAASDAEVGVYFRNLDTGDTVLINADLRMHAASTMKVPVMIQLFRDAEAEALRHRPAHSDRDDLPLDRRRIVV